MLVHREPVNEAALVHLARAGDAAAFGGLVRTHHAQAFVLAQALLGNRADAEDATQEAFLRAWTNLGVLADPARFGGWLRRIVFGTCIDRVRAHRRDLLVSGADALLDVAGGAVSPLEEIVQAELTMRVLAAIAQLPPHYRKPLTLFHIDGLSHARVARALGVPASTVRSLVTRARRRLALLLRDDAGGISPNGPDDVFEEQPATRRLLHVLNGDATREKLERSDLPGTFAVWADVLHEGPVPDVGDERMREIRAQFAADAGWGTPDQALALERQWDRGLAGFSDFEEAVLWFEHDLFDQLILIRHLDWFARQVAVATRLSLICIGEYPGVSRFVGLGQLTPDQLASLMDTRQPVTRRQIELARLAWRAFRSEDPTATERVLARDTSALPFLEGALRRLLEEYPAVEDGLSRTQRQILVALEPGPLDFGGLFRSTQALEERPFMGDTTLLMHVRGLASASRPLVSLEGGAPEDPMAGLVVTLTDTGRQVLRGNVDHVLMNGIDRWLGGVRLIGRQPRWRWERGTKRLRDYGT